MSRKGISEKEAIATPRSPRLTVLLAKRDALFERINKIYSQAKQALESPECQDLFLMSCATIEDTRLNFEKVLDEYNQTLLEIEPDHNVTSLYQCYTAFEDLYCYIKKVKSQLSNSAPAASMSTHKVTPRLPVLELPAFDGNLCNWPLFYSTFNALVHNNNSLSDADKLYYLVGKLSNTARSAFAGIIPSEENYHVIYQALLDKYQDVKTLGTNYLEQALNLKLDSTPSASNYQRFIDTFVVAIKSLKSLKIKDLLDFILVHIAMSKFDTDTIRAFQVYTRDIKIPTFDLFENFIRSQCSIYANSSPVHNYKTNNFKSNMKPRSKTIQPPNPQTYVVNSVSSASIQKCKLCNYTEHDHYYKCNEFHKLSPHDRYKHVKINNACVNCLSRTHKAKECSSKSRCKSCGSPHHTLLHFLNPARFAPPSSTAAPAPPNAPDAICQPVSAQRNDVAYCTTSARESIQALVDTTASNEHLTRSARSTVLLATAKVLVFVDNEPYVIRCLLDSASQSNFITQECCERIGLSNSIISSTTLVRGIGGSEKQIKGSVQFKIYSRFNTNINLELNSLVIDQISDMLPSATVDKGAFSHLGLLPLADDEYATPGPIDCLIGASIYSHLILPGVVHSHYSNVPPALETVLGFVIMGSAPTSHVISSNNMTTLCCSVENAAAIDTLFKRFWELEEVSAPPTLSPDDLECEEIFRATTVRDDSGRYVVALPFRNDNSYLSNSYAAAFRRLKCLERKLNASPAIRAAYNEVLRDYLDKGYLSPINLDDDDVTRPSYIIPHHGVIREDKSSTRLRCVLDASCKTVPTGYSLNDILHAGPNLQSDLFSILLNYRLFKITLSADCRQMFLQIVVRESDRRFQRILYRFNTEDPVTAYEFNRVCFGLKSSPFHALRVIRQLITDEGDKFPAAAAAASSCLYMDDIACSVMSTAEAVSLSKELITLFKLGQFDLVKWSSNSNEVLDHIPETHKESCDKLFNADVQHKILGLCWDRSNDCFRFVVSPTDTICTKRTILSAIARLWDIMGIVAPVILFAKLLIKELWLTKCDWDETPPRHIVDSWQQFRSELNSLNKINIPRHLGIVPNCEVNVVGFADASERAYGGVVYLHIRTGSEYNVTLVCAKSRVSPIKVVSVARLELCAAVLLSQLMRKVLDIIQPRYPVSNIFAYSDSRVALCWINASPHRWQTFVANRVVKVTDNIPANRFFHVAGSENPADCLSRGLTPERLVDHPLWFNGPSWLKLDPIDWPSSKLDYDDHSEVLEQRTQAHVLTSKPDDVILYALAQRISSYSKLLRVIVYIYRFVKMLPRRKFISAADLDFAEIKLIIAVQNIYFANDKSNLLKNDPCSPALSKLRPFVDNDGLIRVGGRLTNSAEDYTHKHPYILPRHDVVVDLIIDHYHRKHLHAGPELLMSLLRQRYWILAARRIIRYRIFKCNVCFRSKPKASFPLMADLPSHRVNQVDKAFTHVGCDYAGPLHYTPTRGRGVKGRKAWLCIFTCLTTRALHIEIATDLSTVSFLNAFKRFLARRGPVKCMYSDNGTCFVGARSYLRDLYTFLDEFRPQLGQELSENRIDWKFIPPSAPHWGGSWEIMVKMTKTYLFKAIGQQIVSYEELLTVLTQIEAIVNSRPLTVLSNDPAEPSALTPAHFLNTTPLASIPAPNAEPKNLKERHSLLDSMVQSFWKRWRAEYLHQLQARAKWDIPSVPMQTGTVVVIKTDNTPPFAWPLGVVVEVYPSKDNEIRVVKLKTSKGTYIRPVVKLCPLPNQ